MDFELHCGDNRDVLRSLPDNSIDSIVTDPPYELGFMGKKWDSTGIAYDATLWAECLRVLKPGGHLIAFGGTRTYHRMTVAIEDAGFEIRDCIQWIYGSGFPKSLDVSKALDRQAGADREKVWKRYTENNMAGAYDQRPWLDEARKNGGRMINTNNPSTDAAKAWHGWGTALKPANEPAVLARKPLSGTVADNVMAWGVGALNIDGCRVGTSKDVPHSPRKMPMSTHTIALPSVDHGSGWDENVGRWPANVIFDEEAAQVLDEQSDGASRFFYVAKASRSEREAGLDGMDVRQIDESRKEGNPGGDNPRNRGLSHRANHHPTVKPVELMRYLVRLVTPKGGTVLDPFMGSGSTGCAAMLEGVDFVGIDITPEYVEIARRRIVHHMNQNPMGL